MLLLVDEKHEILQYIKYMYQYKLLGKLFIWPASVALIVLAPQMTK